MNPNLNYAQVNITDNDFPATSIDNIQLARGPNGQVGQHTGVL